MRWRGLRPTRLCSSEVARQQSIGGGALRWATRCALTSGVDLRVKWLTTAATSFWVARVIKPEATQRNCYRSVVLVT
jgi:hypothetical protein